MQAQDRPRLRPFLGAAQDERDPNSVHVFDQLRIQRRALCVSTLEFVALRMFDGEHSLRDVQGAVMEMAGGQLIPLQFFATLAERLDEALFLDGPRFQELLRSPVREPSCLGCYEADPDKLRRQIRGLFTNGKGPGLPREGKPDGKLRASLIPHIDYARGGPTFAWGFKEVFERADASLFVIIGTSHYSPNRYTLTRKHFKTPLGMVETDQRYIDRLVHQYGDGLFDDEVCQLPEHSIELEVVLLQFLYENRRAFRIVPLVVGPFQDSIESGSQPVFRPDVARMIGAIRKVESEITERICYIISGDLAHIGPKFTDPVPVAEPFLSRSREQDHILLQHAEAVDPSGYFRVIADEGDCRRICGLPPTYTLLEAIRPKRGKLLHYDQYVHPDGYESVSFASMGFYE